MNLIRLTVVLSALAALGGCMVAPVSPGYDGRAPGYYAPPVYYGPSIGIGIYGGRRAYGHGYWGR